jgi:FlaA1/EpsC-like NDP-sugar epimerase
MKSIAIFGCGVAGKRAWTQLRHAYRVVNFLDNDPQKQGSRVAGIPVADPAKYDYKRVDHVFIASMYLDEILVQLLELGVPSSKIEYVGQEILTKESQAIDGNLLHKALYLPLRLLRATWK